MKYLPILSRLDLPLANSNLRCKLASIPLLTIASPSQGGEVQPS